MHGQLASPTGRLSERLFACVGSVGDILLRYPLQVPVHFLMDDSRRAMPLSVLQKTPAASAWRQSNGCKPHVLYPCLYGEKLLCYLLLSRKGQPAGLSESLPDCRMNSNLL